MKWSPENIEKLKELCFAELPNAEIAALFGKPLKDIHAARSALGITIPKVKAAKSNVVNPEFERAVQAAEREASTRRLVPRVREAFDRLQDAILITLAYNGTSDGDLHVYAAMSEAVQELRELFTEKLPPL